MTHYTIIFCILFAITFASVPKAYSQCPQFPTSSIAGASGTLCEGATVTLSASASGVPAGSFVEWYLGANSTYNPYSGQGIHIGEFPIEITCNNTPALLYIMVNPDNIQAGGPGDQCDEFLVLWTGSGGFNTSDIVVSNLGNGSFVWDDFIAGNAATFSCGTSLSPGPVPPNAILIIQSNTTNNINININSLCSSGLPVYIIAYNGGSGCAGGYFDNNSPCSSCPVQVNIAGTCPASLSVNYNPPAASIDGWGWSNMGSGVFADVVPPVTIPMYVPDEIIVDDFVWTIPNDFCETMAGGNWYITGILEPPPSGACPDIFTQYFLVDISCPELIISGGGDVCVGNCPDNPTEIMFEIIGNDVPFTADLIVTVSIFPSLPINNLQISDGQKIFVCMGGFLPSFDPNTGVLQVPVLAVGVTATVQVTSLTSAAGCPVTVDPNFVTLNFIAAPTANAGNDIEICEGEDAMLNGSIGGSATDAMWSSAGDGSFVDPQDPGTTYSPGPTDIANGNVVLTLTSMDPNGSCTPATSDMTIVIDAGIDIDLGPAQTVCDNDVVNVTAMMTGGAVSGEWLSSGDGVFNNPSALNTFYTPGANDFNLGFVTIFFDVTDPNVCIGSNDPLMVTFVNAPQVTIPQDIQLCEDEVANIQIVVTGAFTNTMWNVIGDGQLDIINQFEVNYTPGPGDIIMGSAIVSVTVGSPFSECGVTTYNIPVMIILCNCPPFETSAPSGPLCAVSDVLDLSTLFVAGTTGTWSITNQPVGSNPATLVGDVFTTNNSDPGNYTVTYTLDNPQTGCPFESSETVTVINVTSPDAGPDIINCGPGAIALIGVPAPNPPLTVFWESLGDGSFSNASSQAIIYTPGSLDSISTSIALVYNVLDPICGNQSDTMNIIFNTQPFASFSNDTFSICNETDKGSILNFTSLVSGGDLTGIWTNSGGAPVNFSNPSSVDFNGVVTGFYSFTYKTNSAVPPCQDVSYTITVSVQMCLCPIITVQPLPGGICNNQQTLALNAFVIAGAPGTWTILSAPPGSNPATVIGSDMQIQGADPGLYSLRFTFDSAPITACPDSAEIEVLIQDVPTISISSDTSICGASDVPLTAMVGGSATNAVWFTSGSGIFDNTISLNPVYSPSNADLQSGQIRLISKTIDSLGFCPDQLDTMYLNLFSPPFVIWSALKDTVCNVVDSGSIVNLLSFIISGDVTGTWSDVDGAGIDLSDPSQVDFDGVSPGNFHFNYSTLSAMLPCMNVSYVFEVLVEDCACPLLEISDIQNPVCIPASINLNGLITNASPGFWSLYDGPVSASWPIISGNSVITDNASPGQYVLRYQLIDSVPGCTASKFIPFTLDASPFVTSTSLDCDADLLHYTVLVNTNAAAVISDFGVVSVSSPGIFSIQGIPAGQNIILQLSSASANCPFTMPVAAPDCNCTLTIENLADTIFLCKGDTFTLIPIVTSATGIPFNTWIGPGFMIQKPSFRIFKDGTFIWSVRDSLCERRDTFNVKVYDSFVLSDTLLPPFCPGGNDGSVIITDISHGIDPYAVRLDNGAAFLVDVFPDTIKMVSSGNHTLGITDMNGCESLFNITVPDPVDRFLTLGPDQIIKKGDSVLISPQFTNIAVADFLWDPGSFSLGLLPQWIMPEETTSISLSVTDSSGCVFQDEIVIKVTVDQFFYIPTVFSPNGDQINDVLTIETSSSPIDIVSLEIFDRWGSLVHLQTSAPPFSWNGTFKNQPVQSGAYILKLHYKDADGKDHYYVNDITVIH